LNYRGLEENMAVFLPPIHFCTDNAAMIAVAGYHLYNSGRFETNAINMDVYSRTQSRV
jgi:N6-L-threonylcarbamoyladenine synthase